MRKHKNGIAYKTLTPLPAESKSRNVAIRENNLIEGGSISHADSKVVDRPTASSGESEVIAICDDADLEITFEHEISRVVQRTSLLARSSAITSTSRYFKLLLDPARFAEGRQVAAHKQDARFDRLDSMDSSKNLPQVHIQDIGRISAVRSIDHLLADYIRLLHALPLSTPHPPILNLANLSVVADRFDSLDSLRRYAHTNRLFTLLDAKSPRPKTHMAEDRLRQRCYLGLQLEHDAWLVTASQRLIQSTLFPQADPKDPAWYDLPASLEEELYFRRCAILETIESLQGYFLTRYTSRTRQCKLGYDSSVACDGFQLGEMVKFFSRTGTLALAGSLVPSASELSWHSQDANIKGQDGYAGDMVDLLDKLRQCPEYQIDANHHHCGIRTRLLPLLDLLDKAISDAGICLDCWLHRRQEYSWQEAKPTVVWRRDARGYGMSAVSSCGRRHDWIRDLCLARERTWEVENQPNHMLGTTWSISAKTNTFLR